MPRRRRESKRRHELTLDVLNVLVLVRRESWEAFWGGPAEGRAAFLALRYAPVLEARTDETYERWITRLEAETIAAERAPDPRLSAGPPVDRAHEDGDGGDGTDEDGDEPWHG